jgi:hypothetical protein
VTLQSELKNSYSNVVIRSSNITCALVSSSSKRIERKRKGGRKDEEEDEGREEKGRVRRKEGEGEG